MQKVMATFLSIVLSAAAYSQFNALANADTFVDGDTVSMAAIRQTPIPLQAQTFSNTHVLPAGDIADAPGRTIAANILWSGLAGMGLGASAVLADTSPGYRTRSRDVLMFSVVGAGAGIVVGVVTGIVKAVKQKKRNN